MELSEKMKMLGVALGLRKTSRQTMVSIMMTLQSDDEIDDMTWYMGQHPEADERELLAVAFQLAKEANDKKE